MTTECLRVGYLAGSGHTGSTLAALLMDTHPQIASVGETAFTPTAQAKGHARQVCSCGQTYFACPFWQEVFAGVNADGHEFSPHRWTNDYRYSNPWLHRALTRYSSRPLVRWIQDVAADVLPVHRSRMRTVNRVNVSFIRAVLRAAEADVFFDSSKRPFRLRHLLAIPELDIRVVNLVRDVRGYAGSAKRRGQTVEAAATSWRRDRGVIDDITRNMAADRVFLLRYEDLCARPDTTARALYTFLDVQPMTVPDVIHPRDHHVLGNRIRLQDSLQIRLNDRWKTDLTPGEIQRVLDIAGETNQSLGYV
jgi:hypothetical protein